MTEPSNLATVAASMFPGAIVHAARLVLFDLEAMHELRRAVERPERQ